MQTVKHGVHDSSCYIIFHVLFDQYCLGEFDPAHPILSGHPPPLLSWSHSNWKVPTHPSALSHIIGIQSLFSRQTCASTWKVNESKHVSPSFCGGGKFPCQLVLLMSTATHALSIAFKNSFLEENAAASSRKLQSGWKVQLLRLRSFILCSEHGEWLAAG